MTQQHLTKVEPTTVPEPDLADPPSPADHTSLIEVLGLYTSGGFPGVFGVTDDGLVQCESCGVASQPSDVEMHSRRRLEGASDPDDAVVAAAITCPACRICGVIVAQVGPMASAEDAVVTAGLKDCREDDLAPADAAPGEMPNRIDESIEGRPASCARYGEATSRGYSAS